ncbi:YqeG family HAD IIIA-type phosphatase [Alicyclobacillus acidocaldarius]|uniref:YqeG family HAD IIIA-type phosphatase n=1 Tax=Alicyclobacillus acidocaldarius TaxID=405212 RepID=UPI0002FF9B54|nr:YqeG family HAD IIIA-type phosphatase [Alicyclobacillus acidocaldarius]
MRSLAWLSRLMPDEYVASIYEIDLDALWRRGIRLILTDLDNTLVPWNHPDVPSELTAWLRDVHARGFHVCILSNNGEDRVGSFSKLCGVPAVSAAGKPKSRGFLEALRRFQMPPEAAAMVGDQLFTDIQGAKRLGLYAILVLPQNPVEWWGTKISRMAERVVLRRLEARGLRRPEPAADRRRFDD